MNPYLDIQSLHNLDKKEQDDDQGKEIDLFQRAYMPLLLESNASSEYVMSES